jgi:hypothetical protein
MKRFSQICPELFKSPLALVFLTVNLFICFLVSDWEKVLPYLENLNENTCKPAVEKISFGFSCNYGLYLNPVDVFKGFFCLISLPSLITTEIFTLDLKAKYAHWCSETFECIEVISFIFFNSLYWMALGYLIEIAHSRYNRNNSQRENQLRIYSNTD